MLLQGDSRLFLNDHGDWGGWESKYHFCIHEGQEESSGELQASWPHLIPWEMMEEILLEKITKVMKD